MQIELTERTGFPLSFNPETLELETGGNLVFKRQSRKAAYLKDVLLSPESIAPEMEVYQLHELVEAPLERKEALDRYDLTYSFVLIPPRCIGNEFIKTHGHYHPPMPGSALAFPEVYTQIHGTLLLMLQKGDLSNPNRVLDCALFEMTPGFVITVPPGYAHVMINTTQEPALMAGLYGRDFKPDYTPLREKKGLAYYVIQTENHGIGILENPRYLDRPPLRRPAQLGRTPFEPPEADKPVWLSFFSNPEMYAFLTRPEAAARRFAQEFKPEK
jgi:glucose-6-phosphate isomerase